jgi:DNA sulfur modification protein DndC
VFTGRGFSQTILTFLEDITNLYLADSIPWVIGYSGGKDSSATVQLVWQALRQLPAEQRTKPVYVIANDTLVENPIVSRWVLHSFAKMTEEAGKQGLPLTAHRLTPPADNTFFVNLIGRGYASPRPGFRWCTERLKIGPANDFIKATVSTHGEVILLLGARSAESPSRSSSLERRVVVTKDGLTAHPHLPNTFVYTPIQHWSNDDVWVYLMRMPNPWGQSNKDLMALYRGASDDQECPVVVDNSTPSCGTSRFGCWVCTVVEQDRSMGALIRNDPENSWMLPLLRLRDELDPRQAEDKDRALRDFRRMNGAVYLYADRAVPGPYTQRVREEWLRKLLDAQKSIRENGPADMRNLELITLPELEEIRRLWVLGKHEIEDTLPAIYEGCTGVPYPGRRQNWASGLGAEEVSILRGICGRDELHFQLVRELLSIEMQRKTMLRRAGIFEAIESAFRRNFFIDEQDALMRARRLRDSEESIAQRAAGGPEAAPSRAQRVPDSSDSQKTERAS